jgi:hypothetical protein
MSRITELLRLTADALDSGDTPLHHSFLVEHDVTADECLTLAELLAIGARLVATGIEQPRQATAALNAAGLVAVGDALARLA